MNATRVFECMRAVCVLCDCDMGSATTQASKQAITVVMPPSGTLPFLHPPTPIDDRLTTPPTNPMVHQEGRKALCGQNFYEPSPLDFWRGFPLYSLHEYRYLRSVPPLLYAPPPPPSPIHLRVCRAG